MIGQPHRVGELGVSPSGRAYFLASGQPPLCPVGRSLEGLTTKNQRSSRDLQEEGDLLSYSGEPLTAKRAHRRAYWGQKRKTPGRPWQANLAFLMRFP
jgi:hypothetical protein